MEISNGRHQLTASYSVREPLPGLGCPTGYLSQEINPPLPMPPPPGHPHEALRCPRCDSNNTKFCYYNNYSLSQPRYFCKGCRRYWTKGGTLRNVPVGGGCRKNKRSSSSSSPSSSPSSTSSKKLTLHHDNRDSFNLPLPPIAQNGAFLLPNPNPNPSGFLDILRCGMTGTADPPPAISGLPDLYYGFGAGSEDNGVMLPFNHGVSVSDSTMAEGAHAGTSHGSYWNGAGAGSWHGFLVHDGA